MKFKKFKGLLAGVSLLAAVALLGTSCNRGLGCPNNFSMDAALQKTAVQIPSSFLNPIQE